MRIYRASISTLVAACSFAGAAAHANPGAEPRVLFRITLPDASPAELAGAKVALRADFNEIYTWDLVRAPVHVSTQPALFRLALALSESAAVWQEPGTDDDFSPTIVVHELDEPGSAVDVAHGLNVNFENFAVDGSCVAFSAFDPEPAFTYSIYRACVADGALVLREEIDGDLVRDNGNPIALHYNPSAFGGDVLWSAGSFDPFVTAPLLYESATGALTRIIVSADTDYEARALNADSALVSRASGLGANAHIFVRYDRATGALTDLVAPTVGGFNGGWSAMNEDSVVTFDYDFLEGDDQRVFIAEPGRALRSLAGNTADHALGDGVVAYTFRGAPRVHALASGYDVEASAAGIFQGSLRASGQRVSWLELDGTVVVSLPASEAIDALVAVVQDTSMPLLVRAALVTALRVARVAVGVDVRLARAALVAFDGLLALARARGHVSAAAAGPIAAASATIRDALVYGEQGRCGNKSDDDRDGLRDCADPDCATDGLCREAFACGDGRDNDRNGLVDCADGDCAGQPECTESAAECTNGLDDDDDGTADCDDYECEPFAFCQELICDDGIDNDDDGATDCDDSTCASSWACLEQFCDNGADDDADGLADCADPDCALQNVCNEVFCDNGLDDDNDGLTDCEDPTCAFTDACGEQGTLQCGDTLDNDGDDAVDCFELSCGLSLACTTADADLGSALGSVSGDLALGSDALGAPCGFAFGNEATYRWTAPAAGTYLFDTFGTSFDTVLTASGDARLACNDDAVGLQSQVALTLAAGEAVLVVVHAYGGLGEVTTFTLTIGAAP